MRNAVSLDDLEGARAHLERRDAVFASLQSHAGSTLDALARIAEIQRGRREEVIAVHGSLVSSAASISGLELASLFPPPAAVTVSSPEGVLAALDAYSASRARAKEVLEPVMRKTSAAIDALLAALQEERVAIEEHSDVFFGCFSGAAMVAEETRALAAKVEGEARTREAAAANTRELQRKCEAVRGEVEGVLREREEVVGLKARLAAVSSSLLEARERMIDLSAELERAKLREDAAQTEALSERTQRKSVEIQAMCAEVEQASERLFALSSAHHPELLLETSKAVSAVVRQTGLLVPRRLADFTDVTMISSGLTQVFAASYNGRRCVLKQVPVSDKRALDNEIRLLHRLRHPYIVPLEAVFYDSFFCYLQMPFLERGNLNAWVASAPPGSLAAHYGLVFRQVLQAVAFLHDRRVLHRDLNGNNILIKGTGDEPPEALICDFGVSREASMVTSTGVTQRTEGGVVGTKGYIAPEVEAGRRGTAASDLWSCGAILYSLYFPSSPGPAPAQPGDPTAFIPPHPNQHLRSLLAALLTINPRDRPTAVAALSHPFFDGLAGGGHLSSLSSPPSALSSGNLGLRGGGSDQQAGGSPDSVYRRVLQADKDLSSAKAAVAASRPPASTASMLRAKPDTIVESVFKLFSSLSTRHVLSINLDLEDTPTSPAAAAADAAPSSPPQAPASSSLAAFYETFFQTIFQPSYALFEPSSGVSAAALGLPAQGFVRCDVESSLRTDLFLPSAKIRDFAAYEAIGKVLFRSLLDGVGCRLAPLAPVVFKYLQAGEGCLVTMEDLDLVNRGLSSRLLEVLVAPVAAIMDPATGREKLLADEEKSRYVQDLVRWELVGSRSDQLQALRRGFLMVGDAVSAPLLKVTGMDYACLLVTGGAAQIDHAMVLALLDIQISAFPARCSAPGFLRATITELRPVDLFRLVYVLTGRGFIPALGFRHASGKDAMIRVLPAQGPKIVVYRADMTLHIPTDLPTLESFSDEVFRAMFVG